jgi:hypothetical protein
LLINPSPSEKAGKYTIQLTLKDTFGAYSSYLLDVIVIEPYKPLSLILPQSQKSSSSSTKKGVVPGKTEEKVIRSEIAIVKLQ